MNIYIPEFKHSPYSIIVLLSVIAGLFSAILLQRKSGIKKQTIVYTAFLVFFSILIVAFSFGSVVQFDSYALGFSGIGGAFGLIIAVVASTFIFRDKPDCLCASFVISAPLMYSLSKLGCLLVGCCHGFEYHGPFALTYAVHSNKSYFPVQAFDIISFLLIYILLLFLFFKVGNKFKLIYTALCIMIPIRFAEDFMRESHGERIISNSQIEVLFVSIFSLVLVFVWQKLLQKRTADNS